MTEFRSRITRFIATSLTGLLAIMQIFTLVPVSTVNAAVSTSVVISQIQTGSGTDEFVELYNLSSSSADISGWTLQYKTASGGSFSTIATIPAATSLPSNKHYLVGGSSYSNASVLADLTDSLGMAQAGGHVRLMNGGTVVDLVGYGTADTPEVSAATAPGNGQSIERKPGGTSGNGQDTDNNATDFSAPGTPSPRNLTSSALPTSSPTPSPEPSPTTTVTPSSVTASIAYRASGNATAATHFGVTTINAEVTTSTNSLSNFFITLNRPGSDTVIIPLTFDSSSNTWKTLYGFVIWPANSPQDGTITASLSATSNTFTVTAGSSFTIDTKVNKPVPTNTSRCATNQDSLSASVDSDVVRVHIYRHSNQDPAYLVAVASASNGRIDEVFIGNNTFSTLYLVAEDSTGNRSQAAEAINDVTAPNTPSLQLESGDRVITASWTQVSGASSYILRWRKVSETDWQQKTVTTFKHDITVENDVEYEISVASEDTACNQSAFATVKAISRPTAHLTRGPKGGIADHENTILTAALGDIAIAETKDGEAVTKSPFSTQEDKDQNGVKDAEEDKDRNGIKDGEEDKDNNGIKDAEEDKDNNGVKDTEEDRNNNGVKDSEEQQTDQQARDRSRLIVGIAIALILAGTAIAAYSWYQGEGDSNGASSGPKPAPKPTPTKEDAAAPIEKSTKKGSSKGRSKRKTRW